MSEWLAEHWRKLGAQALAVSKELPDKLSRDAMHQIADMYKRLAEHADRQRSTATVKGVKVDLGQRRQRLRLV